MTEEGHRVELIRRIHDTPTLVSLAVTGGGIAAVSDLLAVPGASRTVVEATVPYAEAALADLLGRRPEQAVSPGTAVAMAEACRRRALRLMPEADSPIAGVACTAALATDRPKRGEHRAHVATCTGAGNAVWSLTLAKGVRDRGGEDRLVSDLVLAMVAFACGFEGMHLLHLDPADALTQPG